MRQFVQVSNLSPEVNTRQQTIYLNVTTNGTYPIILKSGLRERIVGVSYLSIAGTCTVNVQVNSTNVPGLTGLNVSTSVHTGVSTGDNDTNILDLGETLNLVVSSASSLNTIVLNLYTRQIASVGGWDEANQDYSDPQSCEYVFANVQATDNPPNPGSGGDGGGGQTPSIAVGGFAQP